MKTLIGQPNIRSTIDKSKKKKRERLFNPLLSPIMSKYQLEKFEEPKKQMKLYKNWKIDNEDKLAEAIKQQDIGLVDLKNLPLSEYLKHGLEIQDDMKNVQIDMHFMANFPEFFVENSLEFDVVCSVEGMLKDKVDWEAKYVKDFELTPLEV